VATFQLFWLIISIQFNIQAFDDENVCTPKFSLTDQATIHQPWQLVHSVLPWIILLLITLTYANFSQKQTWCTSPKLAWSQHLTVMKLLTLKKTIYLKAYLQLLWYLQPVGYKHHPLCVTSNASAETNMRSLLLIS